ncbi:hypothetical protein CRUP_027197 [Coryphaenoides rupestris]|nr:hypothetical protein CRUP_027197 [Coryphaenoides rupestris]
MPHNSTQPDADCVYNCGECNKSFNHLSSLRRHMRMHEPTAAGTSNTSGTGPNPIHIKAQLDPSLPHSTQDTVPPSSNSCSSPDKIFSCSDCGKGFKKKGHLLQHGVIHSSARPYGCSTCSRAFNRRESLTRHEKIHEEKPFRCPACGRSFRESTSLLNHAASGTCGKPGRGPKQRCDKAGTDGNDSLRRHSKLHQKGEIEEVPATPSGENLNSFNPNTQCSVAQDGSQNEANTSSSYYSYPQDVKPQGADTQPPPRLYTCAICWKSFRHHFHLTAHHQTVHEGGSEKLFCCEVCGKAFAYSNSLTRHRQSQHGLTRAEQPNPREGSSGSADSRGGADVGQSASESEAATNVLLQMAPSAETHAFTHRATHRARGSFSCRRCSAGFWNATLLGRHKAFCRRRAKGFQRGSTLSPQPSKMAAQRGNQEDCSRSSFQQEVYGY